MELYLNDSGAWHMHSDGSFQQNPLEGTGQQVQATLMDRWRGGL